MAHSSVGNAFTESTKIVQKAARGNFNVELEQDKKINEIEVKLTEDLKLTGKVIINGLEWHNYNSGCVSSVYVWPVLDCIGWHYFISRCGQSCTYSSVQLSG